MGVNFPFVSQKLLPSPISAAVSSQPDVAATRRALGRKLLTHPGQQLTIQAWIDHQCQDTARVARYRERLQDLGWFMKALKEPLARLANKEDDCKGTFWEARYKSIAILDEQALLATCTYIDLNPFAAGIAKTPEDAPHTSIKQRVDHVRAKGDLDTLQAAAAATSVATARIEADLEQSFVSNSVTSVSPWSVSCGTVPGRGRKSTRPGANGVVELTPFEFFAPARRSRAATAEAPASPATLKRARSIRAQSQAQAGRHGT